MATKLPTNKVKIYKGIVCLEIYSSHGSKWWYQTTGLGYTPIKIENITNISFGTITGECRNILATKRKIDGKMELIAINIPRSDIIALKRRGMWDSRLNDPYENIIYSTPPQDSFCKNKII